MDWALYLHRSMQVTRPPSLDTIPLLLKCHFIEAILDSQYDVVVHILPVPYPNHLSSIMSLCPPQPPSVSQIRFMSDLIIRCAVESGRELRKRKIDL